MIFIFLYLCDTVANIYHYYALKKKSSFQLLAGIFGSWYIISMFLLIKNVKEREQSLTQQSIPFNFMPITMFS